VVVNAVPLDQYFTDVTQRAALLKPLMMTESMARFDVAVRVRCFGGAWGGGALFWRPFTYLFIHQCKPQPQLTT